MIVSLLDRQPTPVYPTVKDGPMGINVYHFDAVAYKGQVGDTGDKGDTGPAGPKGDKGDTGDAIKEVFIGSSQPTDASARIWIKTSTDLDILRAIRDANPTSQLPTLWLDSEDPYTQWEGVGWGVGVYANKVDALNLGGTHVKDLSLLYKLDRLAH
ncbi:MAG: hypothetical protein ACRCX2_39095, partial [Paraclostridium sp.]